jgi:3-dehydroquinate dehydratase-2
MTNEVMHEFPRRGTRRHRIALIDGPNMSNLGHRSKKVYGPNQLSIDGLHEYVRSFGKSLGVEVETFVSNYEGDILEFIHQSADRVDGYLINPAGLTSSGFAVPHALIESHRPSIEMHFSNPEAAPDSQRGAPVGPLKSWFSSYVTGKMTGLRQYCYIGALVALTLALDDEEFLGAEADTERDARAD